MSQTVFVVVGLIVLVTLILVGGLARLFRKAGPNEALIVYGMRGKRVVGMEPSSFPWWSRRGCCRWS